ncbi:membrane-associated phospholipid phosphatase [Nitrobacteraceae bacterium AZCC 1564]
MPLGSGASQPANYFAQVGWFVWQSIARLAGAPSHSRCAEARRALALRWVLLCTCAALVIGMLMFAIDVATIKLMPPRGTPSLWPVRIFTDFAKSTYVLWALAAWLTLIVFILPRLNGVSRAILIGFGLRVQYIFFAVLVAVLASEVLKYVVGRGRPFVGGEANAFYFKHFTESEAFASLPSGHAVTAFALAFAVSSIWRKAGALMWTFAVLICCSRVILLAHHPSDVVAGALTGVIGAMFVRYWFAARRLGFTIDRNGTIIPLAGPSWQGLKRVARDAVAP